MPDLPSAEAVAKKWGQRTQAASTDYVAGVKAVTESPMEKAANARDKYVARMQDPATHDKWERKTRAVSMSSWKDRVEKVGAGRFGTGVAQAVSKFQAAIGPVLVHIRSGMSVIEGMPNVTPQDAKNRMIAWFDHMSAYGGQ